jgi:hypothetical protein
MKRLTRWLHPASLVLTAALAAACNDDTTDPGTTEPGAAVINADITANRTLRKDTVYTLSGFIHVNSGVTLTIEAGTKILGDYNTLGSSLFIMRGARIRAMGTALEPIVFTSSRPVGQRQAGDWGGLIIIGNARINRTSPTLVEGTGTGPSNPEINYAGGTDNTDSSGELHYVRVEFAGYAPSDGNELNSFTFAAVGSGTLLDHLQAVNGLDDAFEFFGGAVDAKYLVSYETGDDHFDMSEGFSGRLQYLVALQTKVLNPRTGAGFVATDPQGIENDGCNGANCTSGHDSQPFTLPVVANYTLVGTGPGVLAATTQGGFGAVLRRGTGGYYVNGIVARWPAAAMGIRDAGTGTRITNNNLMIRNLLTSDNPVLFQTGQLTVDAVANALETVTSGAATLFTALAATPTSETQLDWTPSATSAARTGGLATFSGNLATAAGTFVTGTSYRGAADPAGTKWWQGWTVYTSN